MLSCLNHYEGDCTRKVLDFILSFLAMAKLKQARFARLAQRKRAHYIICADSDGALPFDFCLQYGLLFI